MKKILMTIVCCLTMMATYAQGPKVTLSNGVKMPQFGIGTFAVPSNQVCKEAVLTALLNASYEQAQQIAKMDVADAQEKEEAQLMELSAKKWKWMADKNVEELAKLFHQDAMFVHMGGYWGRTAELQTIEKGFIWYKHADVHRVEARCSGNTAVVYSDIQLTSEVGGREVSFPFFVSEAYTKTDAGWQLVTLAFTKKM